MDSRHSGFLKGIQLLTIETVDLKLAIAGNLDLQRYNEDSYKSFIEDKEAMYFSCSEEAMVQIFDVGTQQLVEANGQPFLPIFFENGKYELQVQPKDDEAIKFWHEYEGFRNAIHPFLNTKALTGTLHFQNEVGFSNFEIRDGQDKTLLSVIIEVYPTKLDYKKDYRALLDEVTEEVYNLAYAFIKRTYLYGSVEIYKEPTGVEFYRLLEKHFEEYMKAIHLIEQRPHRRLVTIHEEVRGDRLRKQDSRGRAFLRKNANLFVEVEKGIPINGTQMLPGKGLLIKKIHTNDTHENRYVKMTLTRLYARIEALYQAINSISNKRFEKVPDPEILSTLQRMKSQLEQKIKMPFWRSIGKLDRSVISLVMQMAAGYRDVYQIFGILSKGIILQGELYKMSIKDIATLYEYWTFIKLGKILNAKCEQISQDIIKVSSDGLVVNLNQNSGAKRVFRNYETGEIILLQYQYTTKKKITVNQKPDTMLSIEKLGRDYHYQYIFDAKYRINLNDENKNGPGPMEDDINTMHRYRDAIVAESDGVFERTAFGAYVLFPWNDTDRYQEHDLYKSIEKVNIGGLPFLPHATDLVEAIIDNLLNKSADELQEEGILPIGTKEFLYETKVDYVLILPMNGNLEKVLLERRIQVPKDSLPEQWKSAKKIALFTSEGIREEGNIVKVERKGKHLLFQVESWASKIDIIQSDGYVLKEPILVEEHVYNDSNNVPELFISSDEKRQLWLMLKGKSSDVMLELDSKVVNRNSKVRSFLLGEHEFVWTKNNLLHLYRDYIEEISISELKHNSFKVLNELAAKL
ncbi:restriction endonuclease-like protein [Lysinibacillus yapensis]|nr:restriction endonuclease-like protein [Lysinibacillus yapensis]